ncbi:autoinducer 2 ABC transporter substrate-binding protein [Tessaracoccus antarcticus]|uniref:Autoinducer 2 ABC transporter substrate-binding protein n=1 Tax=Tessaracoccus antarcticus TaxID=2479848 RepID=A0A3M0GBR7_9ACTN|nr:autoinducer 2 ABC transporter substrate-binding protein [Tessaracoccus antarcticus]RMB61808.1 autoinducer 2 ABC transporter substrate-binding protein [Tessaracoccus antarcticus]
MTRKYLLRGGALVAGLSLALTGCGTVGETSPTPGQSTDGASSGDVVMVTVVKAQTIPWFQRMEQGVKAFAERTGIDARQEGADDVSPEKQVQIVQDLIAQKPTAITVVPNSPEALESVLTQAREQGIIVVSHEATGIKNVDVDIEAFDNVAYGSDIMKNLGECTGGKGEYVQFVGGLTAKTHMEWVGAAYDYQQEKFPEMKRVETPIESTDDQDTAYQRAKELLAKYPNLAAFQGSAGNDVPGIARAVQEAGLEDKVCVMGTSIPSVANQYLADGSIDKIFFWDPALAGEAQLQIAKILHEGGKIAAGTDLGIEGYNDLQPMEGFDNVFVGAAQVAADAEAAKQFDF